MINAWWLVVIVPVVTLWGWHRGVKAGQRAVIKATTRLLDAQQDARLWKLLRAVYPREQGDPLVNKIINRHLQE